MDTNADANTITIPIPVPDDFDLAQCVENALKDIFAPVARLEALKRKPYLLPGEVHELYGISALTLSTKRSRGGGPDYVQLYKGATVTYTHESIQSYLERSKMRG
jgi:hypothetical protein